MSMSYSVQIKETVRRKLLNKWNNTQFLQRKMKTRYEWDFTVIWRRQFQNWKELCWKKTETHEFFGKWSFCNRIVIANHAALIRFCTISEQKSNACSVWEILTKPLRTLYSCANIIYNVKTRTHFFPHLRKKKKSTVEQSLR